MYDEATIVLRGDINGDGMITGIDQTMVKNIVLEKIERTYVLDKASDVTFDDLITGTDITKIKNYILEKITSLNE